MLAVAEALKAQRIGFGLPLDVRYDIEVDANTLRQPRILLSVQTLPTLQFARVPYQLTETINVEVYQPNAANQAYDLKAMVNTILAGVDANQFYAFNGSIEHPDPQGVTFTGSGLDDLTTDFVTTLRGKDALFDVIISSEGTPDSFTWSKNGSAPSAPVAITGARQTLSDGVGIVFAATTGHTAGDSWAIQEWAYASPCIIHSQILASVTPELRPSNRRKAVLKWRGLASWKV